MTEKQTRSERRGMRDLRTAVTARVRSKPMVEGQQYLDLYVLQRDRCRWLRLKDQAEKSIGSIDQALLKIGFLPDGGKREAAGPGPAREAGTDGGAAKGHQATPKRRRSA